MTDEDMASASTFDRSLAAHISVMFGIPLADIEQWQREREEVRELAETDMQVVIACVRAANGLLRGMLGGDFADAGLPPLERIPDRDG